MADSPGSFVASTALCDGGPAPDDWRHLGAPVPWLAVFSARLPETDREVAVLTPAAEATDGQRAGFERARSAWLAAEDSEGVVPVLAHGECPRPYLTVEPWSPPAGPVPPATARRTLIDLAEGVWQVESSGWTPPPREWVRVDPETGSGAVCWPVGNGGETTGVERVAAVGYELLTGEQVPDVTPAWPRGGEPPALWQVVETALTATGTYRNCYELKRALLFGPRPDSEPASVERSESPDPRLGGVGAQLSRRAAVGVLGLGALGLTGLFARGSDTDSAPEQSSDDGILAASFGFVQNRTTLEVIHEGGDTVRAGNLFVRNPRVSGENIYLWSDYPDYDDQTLVSEGDSILIDRRVMSMWFAEVVWQSTDGSREIVLEERQISEEEGFGQG